MILGSAAARTSSAPGEPVDLRLVPVAAGIWAAVLVGLSGSGALAIGVIAAGLMVVALAMAGTSRGRCRWVVVLVGLAVTSGVVTGAARVAAVQTGPVSELAGQGAAVSVLGTVLEDPVASNSQIDPDAQTVVMSFRIDDVTGRGVRTSVRTPVTVLASDPAWSALLPGQRVAADGLLIANERRDVAAMLRVNGPPESRGPPSPISQATEPLRSGLRAAVEHGWGPGRVLVPALVVGDEALVSESMQEQMRDTGLTHLMAVSGTNVTIVVVGVLGLARLAGIRGYTLPAVGLVALVGFVLLARPEPSVVRAGVMGAIAVLGVTVAGRRRGLSALATATTVLLVVDPWLARSAGFALSVLATAAILVLVPAWRDAMGWLPPTAAVLVAAPLAAQIACLPVLVVISEQFSLAAVPANLLAAPAVPPATILGVIATVVAPWWPWLGEQVAALASLPASWITVVAEHGAALPGATLDWAPGPLGVALAVVISLCTVVVSPQVLGRWWASLACCGVGVVVLVVAPTPGWPPHGWAVVACDVGQGDAFVLSAGRGSAVVVDTGPDPPAIRRCLDSLGVTHVPLLVLTHRHADHVGGLDGVLSGRTVSRALVSPVDAGAVPDARAQLEEVGTTVALARPSSVIEVGSQLRLEMLWPRRELGDADEQENNASVVVRAEHRGTTMLFTGDLEPSGQRALLAAEPDLAADILKVPHHGSANQERELFTRVGPDLALIGVGADNRHGHPGSSVLGWLRSAGVTVRRTDLHGSVAVVIDSDGRLAVQTGGPGTP